MKNDPDAVLQNNDQTSTLIGAALQAILDNTSDIMFIKDTDLIYAAVSPLFVQMTGKSSADQVIGRTDFEIFDDKELAKRYVLDDRKLLAEGENLIDYIEPLTDDNGRARYGSTSKYILSDQSGKAIGILGITRDVTREYITRRHYHQELKYLFELPADTYAAVFIDIDSWRIVSQRRQVIGGSTVQPCNTPEELQEIALSSFVDSSSNAAAFYRDFSPASLRSVHGSGRSNLSFRYRRHMPDGSIRWVENVVRFLTDPESGHLCVVLSTRDIDAKKRKELDLVVSAKMDKMTMLLNRETTMRSIQQVLEEDAGLTHALFMIDVDNLKVLNDTLGHQAGDEFLVALARELHSCFRESDIVGRVGGDEFFALMKNVPGISAAQGKSQTLLAAIQAVCARYPSARLSISIGISHYPLNGKTLEALYAQADSALYQAKKNGKNQVVFAPL